MQSMLGEKLNTINVFLGFILDLQDVNIFLYFRNKIVLKIKRQDKVIIRCFYGLKLDQGS